MKSTNLRLTFDVQPRVMVTVTTGSSITVVVVTRTLRSVSAAEPSSVARTWPGTSLLSPETTSAETHSRGSVSSPSRRTAAAKFSGWPSWVALLIRPKPNAWAEEATNHSTAPIAKKVETARIRVG